MACDNEHQLLMRELKKVTLALAETLAPICEVVLHDLTRTDHTIVEIGNNLSGRAVGGPATELGLARIANPDFPDVLVNYPNSFSDGRPVKSTSIGIRDSNGKFVAALCLNLDISFFSSISTYIGEFMQISSLQPGLQEQIRSKEPMTVGRAVRLFAAARNKDPRSLTSDERRALIFQLRADGHMDRRGAPETVARLLGISRSGVYYYQDSSPPRADKGT